jgi:hypothetical protein
MNIPAFPNKGGRKFVQGNEVRISLPSDGMSLRDYFAAKAMAAIINAGGPNGPSSWPVYTERTAYMIADAMLKERDE